MTDPMKVDKAATKTARRRQADGVVRLQQAFGVHPYVLQERREFVGRQARRVKAKTARAARRRNRP